jgi:hypothetical protein
VKGDLKVKLPTLKECMLGLRRPNTYDDLVREDIPWSDWQIKRPFLVDPGNGVEAAEPEAAPDYLLSLGHG